MPERVEGLANGLTNYGDRDFSLYLRRSFAQSMGYSRAMLGKPVVGEQVRTDLEQEHRRRRHDVRADRHLVG